MKKLALLLWLLALGVLGLTACGGGDDGEATAASATGTTNDELAADNESWCQFGQYGIRVVQGDISCHTARRVILDLANNRLPGSWSCNGDGTPDVVCTKEPSSRIVITAYFASGAPAVEAAPENKNRPCGMFEPFPGSGYIALKVAVVEGNLPCRVARRVLKDFTRHFGDWIEDEEVLGRLTRGSWTCHGPEGDIKCKRPHQGATSGGKIRGLCVAGLNGFCLRT